MQAHAQPCGHHPVTIRYRDVAGNIFRLQAEAQSAGPLLRFKLTAHLVHMPHPLRHQALFGPFAVFVHSLLLCH